MAMPRGPSLGGPDNAQQCSKRPGFQGHRGLANFQHTFCRICCFLQDPAAGVRGLAKKGCILLLYPWLTHGVVRLSHNVQLADGI